MWNKILPYTLLLFLSACGTKFQFTEYCGEEGALLVSDSCAPQSVYHFDYTPQHSSPTERWVEGDLINFALKTFTPINKKDLSQGYKESLMNLVSLMVGFFDSKGYVRPPLVPDRYVNLSLYEGKRCSQDALILDKMSLKAKRAAETVFYEDQDQLSVGVNVDMARLVEYVLVFHSPDNHSQPYKKDLSLAVSFDFHELMSSSQSYELIETVMDNLSEASQTCFNLRLESVGL